jgi:hypothetical protein
VASGSEIISFYRDVSSLSKSAILDCGQEIIKLDVFWKMLSIVATQHARHSSKWSGARFLPLCLLLHINRAISRMRC